MANEEQVTLLKKSVKEWNQWREENPLVKIDLFQADLRGVDLKEADLSFTNLIRANLIEANLSRANLNSAYLREADLASAKLEHADLREADLSRADLREAYLENADLNGANLSGADLREANLGRADLWRADLREARLVGTKFAGAWFGSTNLANLDLNQAEGLEEVKHEGPSHISTDTLQLSKGKIPEKFWRRCGLSDVDIEYAKIFREGISAKEGDDILYRIHDLRFGRALQINPLFISYSHADGAFVDAMEMKLDEKGIRFWRDVHDASAGPLEKIVDRAMRLNPTVLLVLSEKSVESDWVEHEATLARRLEKEMGRHVLCPVALDGAWKKCKWEEKLREQIMKYNIMDFSDWKDEEVFGKRFGKLVEGLDLFYKEGR